MNVNPPSDSFMALPFLKRKAPAQAPPSDAYRPSTNDTNQTTTSAGGKRVPFLGFLPNKPRNHFIAMLGEFAGTFLFLFFAFSATQVANAAAAGAEGETDGLAQVPNAGVLLYISLAFGFSLAVNAWIFFRISGGLFNPAVTLGMALIGAVGWVRAGLVFISQILGSIAAAGVVSGLFPSEMNVSTNLSDGTSIARGLFIEMFLTAELVFTIFMLAAEKHKGTFLAPIGIGLALFIAELAGVYFTGGSLNPARSFGPCVVLANFPGYHWIYWLGPALGSILAVGFYRFVKVLEYETANPGQDFDDKEDEAFEFDEEKADTGAHVARPNVAQDPRAASGPDPSQRPSIGGSGAGAAPSASARYDGPEDSRRPSAMTAVENGGKRRSGSDARAPFSGDRYRAGGDAENGELGGHYRVSGL
ncbi:hypothetical protein MBLNU230_g6723t1 [Neophaeotheca triangularis]